MARILVHVEGQTEETFVNTLLGPHLARFGHFASARLLGNARQRSRRGGIRPWPAAKRDILRHLIGDPAGYATTMVDYYAMPGNGADGWPGRENSAISSAERARTVSRALSRAIDLEMGASFDSGRFIPFVAMHEFEGLLFSDSEKLAASLHRPDLANSFMKARSGFDSPEDIDDSPQTAPSKRILDLVPNYQKVLHGNEAMLVIGLEAVRTACPIFNQWISDLESIPVI